MKIIKIILLSFFLSSGCYAAVITSEGSFKHDGNNFSPRQACEIAKKRAKEKAIIDALGLNISLEEVQKCDETDGKFDCRSNQVSIKSLNGEITEMKVIDKNEGIEELADIKLYYCKVVIQANVEQKIIENKNFDFQVSLNKINFIDGDEDLNIKLILGEKTYLNVFIYFPYEKNFKVERIFPNSVEKEKNYIITDQFSLPAKNDKGEQLKYTVNFPREIKREKVDEHLIFIASKKDIKLLNKYFSLEDLNKRLIEIGKNNIVRKVQKTYTIRKK